MQQLTTVCQKYVTEMTNPSTPPLFQKCGRLLSQTFLIDAPGHMELHQALVLV